LTGPADEPADASWRTAIEMLAALDRPSASEGERRAAESIAGWLRDRGCEVAVEREQAHGGYWWPIAAANALAMVGLVPLRRSRGARARLPAATAAAVGAAALWDDLGHGRRWFRRRLLPRRPTWNVVAHTGDRCAERVVVLVAHHDAAHSGLIFHPALGRIGPRLFPVLHERSRNTAPILYLVWLGPVALGFGAALASRRLLRLGSLLSAGTIAVMLDIAARAVVPGANDNLSAVGVLLAVAEALRADPIEGVRVMLVSTGSEESFSEGMQAFGERHFPSLDPERTEFLCLECLGGETLIVLEGEGMLRMREYPAPTRDALAEAARRAGVPIQRGLRTVAATDAIIALRAGYPVATLASVESTKLPRNYHWPSDRPEALDWETLHDAIATAIAFVRERSH
jgi:hypothetical protein